MAESIKVKVLDGTGRTTGKVMELTLVGQKDHGNGVISKSWEGRMGKVEVSATQWKGCWTVSTDKRTDAVTKWEIVK